MYPRNLLLIITVVASVACGLLAQSPDPQPVPETERGRTGLISYAPGRLPSGMPGTYDMAWAARYPDISADGSRIVFASNIGLVLTDTNRITDIYIYDRTTHRHLLASPTPDRRSAAGVAVANTAVTSRISANGRMVIFSSSSPWRLTADTQLRSAIFLFDSINGTLWTIARDYDSDALSASVGLPDVAHAAGQTRIVFASKSSSIVPDDGNGVADVFVYDLISESTRRISLSVEGGDANGASIQPAISRDGNWVAFVSSANNLVADDHNGKADIFLHDLVSRETIRISRGPARVEADGDSQWPAIGGDSGDVVFRSMATNLVPNDTNGVSDVFVYKHATGGVTLVSAGGECIPGNGSSGDWNSTAKGPAISHDGRFVVFASQASNLVPDHDAALFVHDLALGATAGIGLAPKDSSSIGASAVADGGRLVVFEATATLSPMLFNSTAGVFLYERGAAPTPPIAVITAISAAQVLKAPFGQLTLHGRAVVSDPEPASGPIGYAWVSSIDSIIAQTPSEELSAMELSAGRHALTFIVIDGNGEAAASPPQTIVVMPCGRQIRSLILTNPARLRALYPGDSQIDTLEQRLQDLALHPSVDGLVLDVGADPQTTQAYAAWNREPTTARANQVVARIKTQIDQTWRYAPALEYLVIVGDDRVIPFLRVPDVITEVFPEFDTEARFADMLNIPAEMTVGRALRDNQIITDDYYARSPSCYRFGDEPAPRYYVPALGTGRLVEKPAEMLAVIDTFLESDHVAVSHGAVSTQSNSAAGDLAAHECEFMARIGLTTDCIGITEPWSAALFRDRILAANVRNEILSVEHHACHLWFGSTPEFVYARDLETASADLRRTMIISGGCHGGLNVPPYASLPSFDLPQAALSRQANFLGCTGYSVVCGEDMCWSEALTELFVRLLLSGEEPTPGRALVSAKDGYQRATYFSYTALSDKKASLQLTLYGLPMYSYAVAPRAQEGD